MTVLMGVIAVPMSMEMIMIPVNRLITGRPGIKALSSFVKFSLFLC